MKIFFDTEFYENGRTIDLISIGIVREDGLTYYAERADASVTAGQTEWLKENVKPHLMGGLTEKFLTEIAIDIVRFVGERPEFWAYYADYDWVVLCQLYGTMMQLPKGWPMYCRDVKQLCDALGNPRLPKQESAKHNALADALHVKLMWEFLQIDKSEQHYQDVQRGRITDALFAAADRLSFLCKHVPRCEKCGDEQVQLIEWNYPPAPWRCRICKHKWYYEPPLT